MFHVKILEYIKMQAEISFWKFQPASMEYLFRLLHLLYVDIFQMVKMIFFIFIEMIQYIVGRYVRIGFIIMFFIHKCRKHRTFELVAVSCKKFIYHNILYSSRIIGTTISEPAVKAIHHSENIILVIFIVVIKKVKEKKHLFQHLRRSRKNHPGRYICSRTGRYCGHLGGREDIYIYAA